MIAYDSGDFTLENTILANSVGGNCAFNTFGDDFISAGHNLADDLTCTVFTAAGDIQNTDSLLNPLADNGGPTWSHALPEGSPAIDAGGLACPMDDQRYILRPQGLACDIGAYETADGLLVNSARD